MDECLLSFVPSSLIPRVEGDGWTDGRFYSCYLLLGGGGSLFSLSLRVEGCGSFVSKIGS